MDVAALSLQKNRSSCPAEHSSRHYVLFTIDRQYYALSLDHVVRALRMVAITPVPDAPNAVLGMINMAGQMVPVVDLRQLFSQTGKHPELQDLLLVIQIQGQPVAVVVDEVLKILELTAKQVQSPPTAVFQSRFVAATVRQDDNMIMVLDASRLLPNNDEGMVHGVAR
jgi:purine-binding chemotaxis protein CheW